MSNRQDQGPVDSELATRLETLVETDTPWSVESPVADEALELGAFRLVRELGHRPGIRCRLDPGPVAARVAR
jgi:hypothetical protein